MPKDPYNPLDKIHLGENVAKALLAQQVAALPPDPFTGAGIYAIYYAEKNVNEQWAAPIYVGKAVPAGARKGGYGLGESPGEVLYRRLREHGESIQQARNLSLDDFKCRYLVVDDIWIPLGEALLISMFSPLWNKLLDGFGNHDPGAGRYNQQRSTWDEIHPGRPWAEKLRPHSRSKDEIIKSIAEFLR
jgi:hypothetical protein